MTDLNGEWKLVYTSNSELTALLALSRLPFVTVGDITQTIDGPSLTVINKARRPGRNRLRLALQHSGPSQPSDMPVSTKWVERCAAPLSGCACMLDQQ